MITDVQGVAAGGAEATVKASAAVVDVEDKRAIVDPANPELGADPESRSSSESEIEDEEQSMLAWRKPARLPSLPETYETVDIAPESAPWWRKLRSFTGLGFIVAVGYMDPGKSEIQFCTPWRLTLKR